MVFGLQERAHNHHILLYTVVALLRRLPRRCHSDDRSLATDPPNGAKSFVPDAIMLALAWIIPIHPIKNGIPTRES